MAQARSISIAVMATIGLLLLSHSVWAASVYIDPSCSNDGDGSVESPCAGSPAGAGPFNTWASVTWTAGNSYLQKKGTTFTATRITVTASGTRANPITLGAYGSGAKPIVRNEAGGALTQTILINTDVAWIVIDGLEVHGALNVTAGQAADAIRNAASDFNVPVNLTVQNCTIGPVVSPGGVGNDGIDLRGQGLYVYDNTIADIPDDGIVLRSDDATDDLIVRGNTVSRVSQSGTLGDGIQVSGSSLNTLIEDNYVDHSDVDSKHCIVSNSHTIIRYNECHAYVGGASNIGILCDTNVCKILGNTIYNGKVSIANNGIAGSETVGNLAVGAATYGIEIDAPSLVANNTVRNRGSGLAAIRVIDAGAVTVYNNIVDNETEGIRLAAGAGHVESNNMFHGGIVTPVYNTTAGAAQAAVNGVTASSQFIDVTGLDFRTIANSTARRAGLQGYSCTDPRGRPCWNTPDIGAYQATSGDPANTRTARQ